MSLVTKSTKRNRTYPRAFDHERAQKLRKAGWSYPELARHFGVSVSAVARVCDPRIRGKMARNNAESIRRKRPLCMGGCGRRIWSGHQPDRSGFCSKCYGEWLSSLGERATELYCYLCNEWQPDDAFGPTGAKRRRGRRNECRRCEAARRKKNRDENLERERAKANARYRARATK